MTYSKFLSVPMGGFFEPIGDNLDKPVLSQSGGSIPKSRFKTNESRYYFTATNDPIWIRFSWTTNYPGSRLIQMYG